MKSHECSCLLAARCDDICACLFGSIPGVEFTVYDDNPSVVCGCQSGPLPFYEPGLEELLASLRGKNLSFTSSLEETVSKSQIIFVCINTPLKKSGTGAGKAPDLSG
jgi:UDPglucose 6-dehydrogenase